MTKIVGIISPTVESTLGITCATDRNIYLGDTNIQHMKNSHPVDYEKYKDELENILSNPDYIGLNPNDDSIEYVKEFIQDNEYVKVAVRISSGDKYFARSMYVLNKNRVRNFIAKGTLKKS